MYAHHEESNTTVAAPVDQVFAALDDHARLSSHMSQSSWRMGGGRMETSMDAKLGRSVGSHIILQGTVFGLRLFVEEVVTAHEPPLRKVWETIGTPRLIVIGPYRMSFELTPRGSATELRVSIDYDRPAHGFARFLGRLFGRPYARWCTRQMGSDAVRLFASPAAPA